MSIKSIFNQIDSISTYPKLGVKIQATLKADFEPKTVKKLVKGKEEDVIIPKIKAGTVFTLIKMDFFWLDKKEKGGVGIDIGIMEYLRLTSPDGTETKYFDLFEYAVVEK